MKSKQKEAISFDYSGFNTIAYQEWGPRHASKVAFCVHGLTRNSHDFDFFAEKLAKRGWRVVCPDLPGRGDSGWLADASAYNLPNYVQHMAALIARVNPLGGVYWVGTSLGGVIGMMLAGYPQSPVRKLVMNDIGPYVPAVGMKRIAGYVGLDPRFDSIEEVCAHLREKHPGLGPLTDDQWMYLARYFCKPAENGTLRLHYDPKIAQGFKNTEATDLWGLWHLVCCPVLATRGGRSDVLPADVAAHMQRTGPKADLIYWPEVAHAPLLMSDKQAMPVIEWLER